MLALPALVVHADWSVLPTKRWQAAAVYDRHANLYRLNAPAPVGDTTDWLARLRAQAHPTVTERFPFHVEESAQSEAHSTAGAVFLGVDFPIGLPLAWAQCAGVADFLDLLPHLGTGEWTDFYRPAGSPDEISLGRPFYPARPGQTCQQHLLDALGVSTIDALRRRCDRGHATRRPAAPLFWTMGAQQVGKAAISGWRDVLGPALRNGLDVAIWPFAGPLDALLARGGLVVAESYPAEFYGHLGILFPRAAGGKRRQNARASNAKLLLTWAAANPVVLSDALEADLRNGFGTAADGEDRFDAVVGLFGMLNILFGHRQAGEPDDGAARRVEGWILGLADGRSVDASSLSRQPRETD